jgi:hypothetical protein
MISYVTFSPLADLKNGTGIGRKFWAKVSYELIRNIDLYISGKKSIFKAAFLGVVEKGWKNEQIELKVETHAHFILHSI